MDYMAEKIVIYREKSEKTHNWKAQQTFLGKQEYLNHATKIKK